MPSVKSMRASLLLVYLLLPPLLCENLLCFYSPYTTEETKSNEFFKPVLTECPPDHLCYKATGYYGEQLWLTHKGCTLQKDCDRVKKIEVKTVEYNTSYSCCDWSYCNRGTGVSASIANVMIVLGLTVLMGPCNML